jgi:hypothetical protein
MMTKVTSTTIRIPNNPKSPKNLESFGSMTQGALMLIISFQIIISAQRSTQPGILYHFVCLISFVAPPTFTSW